MEEHVKPEVENEKNGSEAVCVRAMTSYNAGVSYSNVIQIRLDARLDTDFHVDIIAERDAGGGRRLTRLVDVKSLTPKNLNTGNYCVGERCYDTVMRDASGVRDFAFRLAEGGRLTDRFLIADARDVLAKCRPERRESGGSAFYLVPIDAVRANCECFFVEPDVCAAE